METTVYRLTFKTQLHLGRATGAAQTGSLGLEKTETYISADTLFSAICQTWATFYNTASLTEFLNPYTAESGSLPITLTSAFPFADQVYFFPKPLMHNYRPGDEESADHPSLAKKRKRVQYVSNDIFQGIITGTSPPFAKQNLINSEDIWVSTDEKHQLNKVMNDAPIVWEKKTRPRVSIDRQTDESSIWHVETVQFNKKCGLWFAAKYDSDATKHKIETLLRVLGDCGIGGERNAGYGQFAFEPATNFQLPATEGNDQFVTLSPICPKSEAQLSQLRIGRTAYTLTPITGWVSTTGSNDFRQHIHMFAEGSILNTCDESIGRLVDLKPKDYPHPVYRYGYAWQIGINDISKPVGAVS